MTMLRVSYSDTADGQCWRLYGRLTGPWVEELRSCWRQARERVPLAHAVVDLNEVTFIDEAGEELLGEMLSTGTEFIATGIATKHLLEGLKNQRKRTPRRRVEDLSAPRAELEMPQDGEK
jgi:phage tail protein X